MRRKFLALMAVLATIQASALTIYVHYPDDVTAEGRHLYVWDGSGNELNDAYPGKTISESEVLSGKTWYKFETNADVVGVIVNDNYLNRTGDIAGITKDRFIDITGNTGGQISGTNEWSQVNGILVDAKLFPDANFRAAVAAKYAVNEGEIIPYSVINNARDAKNNWLAGGPFKAKHITSIKGAEYFPQLSMLDVSENDFETLDTGDIKILSTLYCNNNTRPLTLDVSRNATLSILDCYKSSMTSLDVKSNLNLRWVNCSGNKFTALDFSDLPKLSYLHAEENRSLTQLNVTNCAKLDTLCIHTCGFTGDQTVDLSTNTNLTWLSFNLTKIQHINLENNTALKYLYCEDANLQELDLSHNVNLLYLASHRNVNIRTLDVSMLEKIQYLYVERNGLTEIDVTNCKNLIGLNVHYNPVRTLDLSQNNQLRYLYAQNAELHTLDISPMAKSITQMNVQNNHLIQLDATGKNIGSFFGNGQTRTMKATIEMVNGELKYVLTMPNNTPVPDGLGGIETFVNNDVMYIQQVVTDGVTCEKGEDGLTRFYIPLTKPKTVKYQYKMNNTGTTTPLETTITVIYPDPAFKLDGNYRSTFQPAELQNSYKNSITLVPKFDQGVNSFDGATYTLTRKAANSDAKETVATVTLSLEEGVYHYNVTYPQGAWATNPDQEGRWDNVPVVTSGIVTDDIKIVDYFAASTAEGGDKAESYTYALREDLLANKITVPVYAATTSAYLVSDYNAWYADHSKVGYTLDQIMADTDHSLEPTHGVAVSNTAMGNSDVINHTLYCNNEVVGTTVNQYFHELSNSVDLSYVYALNTKVGDETNSYGTNGSSVHVANATATAADLQQSKYTFHEGSRFYSCLLNVNVEGGEGVTTKYGGFRVWRNCDDTDMEYENQVCHSDNFLMFENMNLEDNVSAVNEVGEGKVTLTLSDGTTHEVSTGVFGCSSVPEATYTVRVYYSISLEDDPEQVTYYVAEEEIKVSWNKGGGIYTAINDIDTNEVASVRYYNLAGHCSNKPFDGVNIVVTTYTNGSKATHKVIK